MTEQLYHKKYLKYKYKYNVKRGGADNSQTLTRRVTQESPNLFAYSGPQNQINTSDFTNITNTSKRPNIQINLDLYKIRSNQLISPDQLSVQYANPQFSKEGTYYAGFVPNPRFPLFDLITKTFKNDGLYLFIDNVPFWYVGPEDLLEKISNTDLIDSDEMIIYAQFEHTHSQVDTNAYPTSKFRFNYEEKKWQHYIEHSNSWLDVVIILHGNNTTTSSSGKVKIELCVIRGNKYLGVIDAFQSIVS